MIDVRELGFLVKDMEGMVRKMERYVNVTASLYSEMEVLNGFNSIVAFLRRETGGFRRGKGMFNEVKGKGIINEKWSREMKGKGMFNEDTLVKKNIS